MIRNLEQSDCSRWLEMRSALWPSWDSADHRNEMNRMLKDPDSNMFVFVDPNDGVIGFLECAIRKFVNGCKTSPVGFVEGIFVEPKFRKSGIAKKLFQAAESWAKSNGCKEMASDALIDNQLSYEVHIALGYQETEKVVYFRRAL